MLTVASDDPDALEKQVDRLKETLRKVPGTTGAGGSGLKLVFDQRGDTLPGELRGHEHFGFKDRMSEPAVRGRLSEGPDDFLTPRFVDAADAWARLLAAPGSVLCLSGPVRVRLRAAGPERRRGRALQSGRRSHVGERRMVPGHPKAEAGREGLSGRQSLGRLRALARKPGFAGSDRRRACRETGRTLVERRPSRAISPGRR